MKRCAARLYTMTHRSRSALIHDAFRYVILIFVVRVKRIVGNNVVNVYTVNPIFEVIENQSSWHVARISEVPIAIALVVMTEAGVYNS